MHRHLFAIAAALLLVAFSASAERSLMRRAYVISVDSAAKTIKFRHKEKNGWEETSATWDENTKWANAEAGFGVKTKPATVALAAQLHKDSKIYVGYTDRHSDGEEWWFELVETMPADENVEE